MDVLLTVGSIFSEPKEGPAVPAGAAVGDTGGHEGTLGGHGAGDGDRDAPGDPTVPQELFITSSTCVGYSDNSSPTF